MLNFLVILRSKIAQSLPQIIPEKNLHEVNILFDSQPNPMDSMVTTWLPSAHGVLHLQPFGSTAARSQTALWPLLDLSVATGTDKAEEGVGRSKTSRGHRRNS